LLWVLVDPTACLGLRLVLVLGLALRLSLHVPPEFVMTVFLRS
jgi:hypothetical protein